MSIIKFLFTYIIRLLLLLVVIFLASQFIYSFLPLTFSLHISTSLSIYSLFCFIFILFINKRNSFYKVTGKTKDLICLILISLMFTSAYFSSTTYLITSELGKQLSFKEKLSIYTFQFSNLRTHQTNYNRLKIDKSVSVYGNVHIYYQESEEELLPVIHHSIDQAEALTTKLLGNVEDSSIDLILHESTEELYNQTSLEQTMGYFDDPNDIMGIAITDLPAILDDQLPHSFHFRSTILHEYTHYRLQAYIRQEGLYLYRIPLWFHEGVAEYIGMNNVAHPLHTFEETDFKHLITHQDWEEYRLRGYHVYLQSYYAIRFIIDTYGEEIIRDIIEKTAITNDFEEGFKEATGLTIEMLQEKYIQIKPA
ncbi:hypothetical protein ACNRWW_16755 [Metabacillus sp. HB246100]